MADCKKKIGPYILQDKLGQGGMGVVYRAEHSVTGQHVALKTVHLPDEKRLFSIQREIRALARIRHPGIIKILDEGVEASLPWYAMDLIQGVTLDRFCRDSIWNDFSNKGDLGVSHVPVDTMDHHWWTQILTTTLDHIGEYSQEPLNNFAKKLTPLETPVKLPAAGGHLPRVLRIISRDALDSTPSTGGTLLFISPEQIINSLVDARADLYTLGSIFYLMVTGHVPFTCHTSSEALHAHLNVTPLAPSTLVTGLPKDIDQLIVTLLEKEASKRPSHADRIILQLKSHGISPDWDRPCPTARSFLFPPRFTGRKQRFQTVCRRIDHLQEKKGSLFLISGESGIGKTRMLMEIYHHFSRSRFYLFSGDCMPVTASGHDNPNASPLYALQRMFSEIADLCQCDDGLFNAILKDSARILEDYFLPIKHWVSVKNLPDPPELPPESAQLRLFTTLAGVISSLSTRKPVIILLDNLHCAGEMVLNFLEFLLRSGYFARYTVLLVGTYRVEEQTGGLQRLIQINPCKPMFLNRLELSAIRGIIRDMMAIENPSGAFATHLATFSDGNPFFVAEYLRTCLEELLLFRDAQGDWQLKLESAEYATEKELTSLPLPSSLRELVLRWLGILSEAARELVPAHQASDLHVRIAQAIEQTYAGTIEDYFEFAGFHWERAGETARAAAYYIQAARRSVKQYAVGDANRLYRHYLNLQTENNRDRVRARNELASNVLAFQGKTVEAAAEQRLALMEARQLGDEMLIAMNLTGMAYFENLAGNNDAAVEKCREALAIFRKNGESRGEGDSLNNLGSILLRLGDMDGALQHFEAALEAYRKDDYEAGEATALMNIGNFYTKASRLQEAEASFTSALEINRRLGILHLEADNTKNLAAIQWTLGNMTESKRLSWMAVEKFRQAGDRRREGAALTNLALIMHDLEDLDAAADMNAQALNIHREVADRFAEAVTLSNFGHGNCAQGDLILALEKFNQSEAILRNIDAKHALARTIHGSAMVLRYVGADCNPAMEKIQETETILDSIGDFLGLAQCFCEAGHLKMACGTAPDDCLAKVEKITYPHDLTADSEVSMAKQKLKRAADAFYSHGELLCGECPQDIPAQLRRRIEQEKI